MTIDGTKHNDMLTGTSGNDIFDLGAGGSDTASGLDGSDSFRMGSALNSADRLDGGDGNDRVVLNGDYAQSLSLGAHTLTSVENILFAPGHDYALTTNDGNLAAGDVLQVNAGNLAAANALTFNGSHETNGRFVITGGGGDDHLIGGEGADTFRLWLSGGGDDVIKGGAGGDLIHLGHALTAADAISGGAGNDTVFVNGNYSSLVTFDGSTIQSVETLSLGSGHDYNLRFADGNVDAGNTLIVDASRLGMNDHAFIDGGLLTAGALHFIDGAGRNVFTGGDSSDVFDLRNGHVDNASGGDGNDIFNFGANFTALFGVNGGAGANIVTFDGDYSTPLALAGAGAGSAFTDIRSVLFLGSHTYTDVEINGDIAGGSTLTLDGSASASIDFDLTAATSTAYGITGSVGDDEAIFLGNFATGDRFDGGRGNDALTLRGDYSAGFTFGAATLANVETLNLQGGFGDHVILNDANIAAAETLTVNCGGSEDTIDASGETDGHLNVQDMFGSIHATGGALADTFFVQDDFNANSSVTGGGGDDVVTQAGGMNFFDGGSGNDTFIYDGVNTEKFCGLGESVAGAVKLGSVETLQAGADGDTGFTLTDAVVSAGQTLTVNASVLTSGHTFTFDGSAETDGTFNIIGGAGTNVVVDGAGADTLDFSAGGTNTVTGGGGADHIIAGSGVDTFVYTGAGQSSTANYDTISNLNLSHDVFKLPIAVAAIGNGGLESTFVGYISLAAALASPGTSDLFDGTQIEAAILKTSGTVNGQNGEWIIVDANHNGAFDAGIDYIFNVTLFTGGITLADFTT